jgi:RNA polymerase sigma-70 factor (ECF subfamily)
MIHGPEAGLALVEPLMSDLNDYGMAHSARADFYRQLNQNKDAIQSYRRALKLASQEPERRFIESRIQELTEK